MLSNIKSSQGSGNILKTLTKGKYSKTKLIDVSNSSISNPAKEILYCYSFT